MEHTKKQADSFIRRHVRKHIDEYDMTRKQAIAVAYSEARLKGYPVKRRK